MKKAMIIHVEFVEQYFENGVEITPTPQQKLLHSYLGDLSSLTTQVTQFRNVLTVVEYKNGKELAEQFWRVADEFKSFIHPNDMIIEKI